LRIDVLGPLRVTRDGQPLKLGPRQAQLLSLLTLVRGRSIRTDQLARMMWGEPQPRGAAATLRSHVAHLRRTLEPGCSGRDSVVVTEGTGYRLDLAPEDTDVYQFLRLYSEGKRLLTGDSGPAERAAGLIGAALALWRGPAYAEVADQPVALAERTRLMALRRSAWRLHAEALSTVGRHAEAVGSLTVAVAEDPYDEGLRGMLARALYAEQRVDEAAAACREGLTALARRGIEAPALRRLQRDILSRRLEPAAAKTGPVPRTLPPDPPRFAGRCRELETAARHLRGAGAARALIVTGMAGVGKSSFAIRLAHTVAAHFPDGQLYLDLRDTPAQAALGVLLEVLGVAPGAIPDSIEGRAGLYRSLLTGRRALVVLDNAETGDQVRPLLPGAPGCRVLVTSRDGLSSLVASDLVESLTLGPLPAEEAAELLARRIGTARVAAEPAAVDDIVAACGRLPLALALVAGRAAACPGFALTALGDELRDAHGLDAVAGVRTAFDKSFRRLPPGAARLFRLLGLAVGPDVTTTAAASLAALGVREVRPLLDELVAARLLVEHRPGRYAMHPLVRSYAGELADAEPATQRWAARRRLLDHYVHSAHTADRLLWPAGEAATPPVPHAGVTAARFGGRRQALDYLATEQSTLVAALDQAAAAGLEAHAWRLARTLVSYFDETWAVPRSS